MFDLTNDPLGQEDAPLEVIKRHRINFHIFEEHKFAF